MFKKPIALERYEEKKASRMWKRIEEFRNLTFPLSALEIAEMIGYEKCTINRWLGAHGEIPDRVLNDLTHIKVRHYIKRTVITRGTHIGTTCETNLLKRVMLRLEKNMKSGDADLIKMSVKFKASLS